MAAPGSCCNPCEPRTVVEVPGVEGAAGAAGSNAFTVTVTTTWNVPTVGDDTSSIAFGDTSWMVIGQPVYVEGAGVFTVVSKADDTHAVLNYPNYSGNTNSGNPIAAGAQVSPAGTQPVFGILGTGSPEAIVTAEPGQFYVDTASDNLWYKKSGSDSSNWKQLIGAP